METKNYSERVRAIKNEVLSEIRSLLGTDGRHAFKNPPYIHYVEGEVANTEYCLAVEVWSEGMVVFCTGDSLDTPRGKENVTEGDAVFQFEPDSFFRILETLKEEIREEKLRTLRELVKKAGGSVVFDGSFTFVGETEYGYCDNVSLNALLLNSDGRIKIRDTWEDDMYGNTEDFIVTSELDNIIEYVRKQTEKTIEERLALTDEQKELVDNFKNALSAMKQSGVCFVMDDENKQFLFYNGIEIEDLTHGDGNGPAKDHGYVDITDKFVDSVNCDFNYYFGIGYERLFASFE